MKCKKMHNKGKCPITTITDYSLSIIRSLTIFDFAIVKVCLVSIGVLIGYKFNSNIKKATPFILVTAITSYVYLMYTFFFRKIK